MTLVKYIDYDDYKNNNETIVIIKITIIIIRVLKVDEGETH